MKISKNNLEIILGGSRRKAMRKVLVMSGALMLVALMLIIPQTIKNKINLVSNNRKVFMNSILNNSNYKLKIFNHVVMTAKEKEKNAFLGEYNYISLNKKETLFMHPDIYQEYLARPQLDLKATKYSIHEETTYYLVPNREQKYIKKLSRLESFNLNKKLLNYIEPGSVINVFSMELIILWFITTTLFFIFYFFLEKWRYNKMKNSLLKVLTISNLQKSELYIGGKPSLFHYFFYMRSGVLGGQFIVLKNEKTRKVIKTLIACGTPSLKDEEPLKGRLLENKSFKFFVPEKIAQMMINS